MTTKHTWRVQKVADQKPSQGSGWLASFECPYHVHRKSVQLSQEIVAKVQSRQQDLWGQVELTHEMLPETGNHFFFKLVHIICTFCTL